MVAILSKGRLVNDRSFPSDLLVRSPSFDHWQITSRAQHTTQMRSVPQIGGQITPQCFVPNSPDGNKQIEEVK